MSRKVYVGDGVYCYTVNCKRHSKIREFSLSQPSTSGSSSIDVFAEVMKLIDRNDIAWGEYYAATERKHFSDPALPGSKFTDDKVKTLEQLLVTVHEQRGSLDGNDVEEFIKQGANPAAFNEDSRYLRVGLPGKLGIVNSKDLSDDMVITVERTKPTAPCNYVAEVNEQITVNFGTVILTKTPLEGKQRFITAFPGEPTPVSRSKSAADKVNSLEGGVFTVKQIREIVGHDVNVNTRLTK